MKKPTILISAQEIQTRIQELARQIDQDHQGQEILVLCVLKGAFIFCADLIRVLQTPVTIDFVSVSTYGDGRESSGKLNWRFKPSTSLEGKHILVVEDIVDSGFTLKHLMQEFLQQNPASLKLASLLLKPARLAHSIRPDYLGFEIPDQFVIGYGLDDAEKYRELDYIGVIS